MVLALTQAWFDAFRQGTVTPIVHVRITLDPRLVLTILDPAACSNGDTITITQNDLDFPHDPINYVLTAGTDFTFGGLSAAAIAQNIAAAWNTAENARARTAKTGIRATAEGYRVHFVQGAVWEAWGLASSDTNFAVETYSTIPSRVFDFVSGDFPIFGAPCCITDLSTASAKIDAFTRKLTIGAVDIEFGDDGQAIRELARFHRLYLAPVELRIGAPELDFADFALIGTFVIKDWVPEKGKVVLECEDRAEEDWKNRTIRGAWVGKRPLELVDELLASVGATAYDATTLDPSLYSDISHHVVSRYDDQKFKLQNQITDDRPVQEVIDQLIFISGGALLPRNTGIYGYNHYSHTKAVSRTWEASPPGSATEGYDMPTPEIVEAIGRITNSVRISFAQRNGGDNDLEPFELADEFSRLTFGKRIEMTFDLLWCNGYLGGADYYSEATGSPQNAVNTGRIFHDTTHLRLGFAGRQGFCGVAYERVASSWQLKSGASLGGATGRYCYLLLKPPGRYVDVPTTYDPQHEFIAIDQWDLLHQGTDDPNAGLGGVPAPDATRARIASASQQPLVDLAFGDEASPTLFGRGGLDSTVPGSPAPDYNDHWQFNIQAGRPANEIGFTQVVDVTIPIHVAQRTLRRFRFGAPEIRVQTSLEHLDLELGDFVAINGDDLFIGHQQVGLTSAIVWEIVGKEVDILADSPGIIWDLVFVRDDNQNAQTYGFIPPPLTVGGGAISVTPPATDRRLYFLVPGSPGARDVATTLQGEELTHR